MPKIFESVPKSVSRGFVLKESDLTIGENLRNLISEKYR